MAQEKTLSQGQTDRWFTFLKKLLSIFLPAIIILSGVLLLASYGHILGYSEVFNFSFSWADLSFSELKISGIFWLSNNHSIKLLMIPILMLIGISMMLSTPPRTTNEENYREHIKRRPKLLATFKIIDLILTKVTISSIIFLGIIVLALGYSVVIYAGQTDGKKNAQQDLAQYNAIFQHHKQSISIYPNGVVLKTKTATYRGFSVYIDAKQIVIYAVKDGTKTPLTYTFNRSDVVSQASHPQVGKVK